MTNTDKISQEEMVKMFGETMPIEAVNLIWDSPGTMTLGEVRAELRKIAEHLKLEKQGQRMTRDEIAAYAKGLRDADEMIGALWSDLFNKDLIKAAGADYFDKWRGRISELATEKQGTP